MSKMEIFPDGTPIDKWFYEIPNAAENIVGEKYLITEYGIKDDGKVYTEQIQALINTISSNGGGVLVVPKGTYITGALFFKQNVNLLLEEDAVLKGSNDISDYPVGNTRIEGENCLYFPALVNADGLNGFKIFGKGTIDGNGQKAWKAFWARREWNPECTNKDEQRPRLLFLSNCTDAVIIGISLINSQFWAAHFYKCKRAKIIDCRFFSPRLPIAAPSTDAIDIDACSDVLVKNCVFDVNDDAIALKGGKGLSADTNPENGINERIIVEDCLYKFCHGCLTCGSESIHNRNIIVRRIKVKDAINLLWLKMRPDTPQLYEYIHIESVKGHVENLLNINPWTQFLDLKRKKDIPLSYSSHVMVKDCNIDCDFFLNVKADESQYILSDFTFEDLQIKTKTSGLEKNGIKNLQMNNVFLMNKVSLY